MILKLTIAILIAAAFVAPVFSAGDPATCKVENVKWKGEKGKAQGDCPNGKLCFETGCYEVTYKEVADKQCTKSMYGNSAAGVKAGCDRNKDCYGYVITGGSGKMCHKKSLAKGIDFPKVGLDETNKDHVLDGKGKKLFIKMNCKDGIKNQDEEDVDCGGSICDAC